MIDQAREKRLRLFGKRQSAAREPLFRSGTSSGGICTAGTGSPRGSRRRGRISSISPALTCRAFALGRRARTDAELDAVAVAVTVLADALVIDATPALD